MIRRRLVPIFCALALTLSGPALTQSFDTMAQPVEADDGCKAPRPPKDLAETAYIRNGYRAILRIMAAEKWQETGSCNCVIGDFTWDDVVERSEEFATSDNLRLPFNVVALDKQATVLEDARLKSCPVN